MSRRLPQRRTLMLAGAGAMLLILFLWVALRTGPLAPVAVTVATVESRAITPALFGIGTVETRYSYKIGPTYAGRIKRLDVHVGDRIKAGQLLGEMDPVDLDERARSQDAVLRRAEAAVREAEARQAYAQSQLRRYEQLVAVRMVSEEVGTAKRQEGQVADAALTGAREELARARADRGAVRAQHGNLRLVAPVDGIVVARDADPGTTIVAGQAAVEVVDPNSLWINVRFDQVHAGGLAPGLPARIALRSRAGQGLDGHVARIEPLADTVTEETLAKVRFDAAPDALPPIGELAEVTVRLPTLPAAPVIPNAAIQRRGQVLGVWRVVAGQAQFVPVTLGDADLDGWVQVRAGLRQGDQIVVHSDKTLTPDSRIRVVPRLAGVPR
ncbi:efflux RND transporter periplasmic adaptor subunit [Duganella sp. LX20W]|uniref:Efflux RND transporter periplasmic adaptor subunit n=1 Tax=Rugamonas brunnea TaxID=2758569 RepID=A0A7W2IAH9_9BURK|nr:efflux RND transporter periplasmic adaptor subunit [Rugamonas brunnea]MBA5636120.1 efflux RND transporter periplasmic adaptor subunit [Rugamonas brunnea]